MKTNTILKLCLASLLFAACSDDDDTTVEMMEEEMMIEETSTLMLTVENLEEAPAGQTYEGWLVVDGELISVGTFSEMSNSFEVATETLENAFGFQVSIEPMNDMDESQSDVVIMSGPFADTTATLTTTMQIGDFTDASGTFFLRSPTDETMMTGNNGNDQYGVWFGDIDSGMPPVANFTLPELDATRWIYEGWVLVDGTPLSTGRFNAFDMQDDFNGFSSIMSAGPNLPGEDFFMNAPMGIDFPLDVRGRMVVISVEPVENDSPEPFVVKPLAATAGMMLVANQSFELNTAGIPSAVATRPMN